MSDHCGSRPPPDGRGAAGLPVLSRLLDPLPPDVFFAEIWGARHHHIGRETAGYFETLLPGMSSVDELLQHVRTDPSAVRAVRGDQYRESDVYRLANGGLDVAGVLRDFSDGYTIVTNCLEQFRHPVATLSHSLEIELDFPVQVNAYATPPKSAGFLPHYDHHDVLILQLHGSKTWDLHGDAAVPPHEMQRRQDLDPGALPPPDDFPTEVLLTDGDTFYLPRGRMHAAHTTTEPSIHLTIGLHVPTVLTLLTHALQRLSHSDDRIHAPLPVGHLHDPEIRDGLRNLVRDALEVVASPCTVGHALDAMEHLLVRRGRCPPVGKPDAAAAIDGHTKVAKHRPLYSRVTATPGGVALHFAQLTVNADAGYEAALRFVSASTTPFRVRDLPGLTGAQQEDLTLTLIISGFLFLA